MCRSSRLAPHWSEPGLGPGPVPGPAPPLPESGCPWTSGLAWVCVWGPGPGLGAVPGPGPGPALTLLTVAFAWARWNSLGGLWAWLGNSGGECRPALEFHLWK